MMVENGTAHVPEERVDEEQSKDGNENVEDENENEDMLDQTVRCEEEERVEAIVVDIVDSEDEGDGHQTPPQSDGEEEDVRDKYVKYKKGSGKLEILQVFESIKDFKQAVLEYALKYKYNVRYGRGGAMKSDATCAVKDAEIKCAWRIYCSYDPPSGKHMVKTFQEEHTCFKDGRCRIMSDTVIANIFINDVRNDPDLKPKVMQQQIQMDYNFVVTYDQCRKARTKARKQIEADGCFLKSTSKGQLLTVVGRDSNNQIYPIAWAYVQVESTDTWAWFLQLVKRDLELRDGDGFTLVSDRQKGLLKAVSQQLPKVEHRMCARHIYGNLRRKFPKKARLQSLFWNIVESHNLGDYDASMKEMEDYDLTLYQDLMAKNPKTFSRAFFKTTPCCEDALNNFSESYNSAIEKARALPLVEMLETMRRQTMIRIDERKKKTLKHKGKYSVKVSKMIALEEKHRKWKRTGKSRLEAPPREISKGRQRKPEKRKRGVEESPVRGKKATQHGKTVCCCYCGMSGHNSSSCTNVGVPKKPRPPKKAKTQSGQAETFVDDGEGPSQSQPNQHATQE